MQKKINTLALLAIAFFLSSECLHAQSGSLNTSFGDNGLVRERFVENPNAFNEATTGIVQLKDGKSVISVVANARTMLSRLHPDGSIDASFGRNGFSELIRFSGHAALAAADDGSFYVASAFFQVVHVNADGTIDKHFGVNGMSAQLFIPGGVSAVSIAVQDDGKIVLTAGIQSAGIANLGLARLNKDGSLDAGFGNGGKVITDFGFFEQSSSIAIQPDGKIVVGAITGISATMNVLSVIRYNADGQLDLLFGKGGRVIPSATFQAAAQSIAIQPDGKILAAGSMGTPNVFRFQYDGTPDFLFGYNGAASAFFQYSSNLRSMELLPDGRILLVAEINSNPAAFKREIGLMEFDTHGMLYKPFGNLGMSTVYYGPYLNNVRAMKVREDGKITIVGSIQSSINTLGDYAILQCLPHGFLDQEFGTGGQIIRTVAGEVSGYRAVTVQDHNKILVGGVTNINNESDFILARYLQDGSPDQSFGEKGKVRSNIGLGESLLALQVLSDNKILAAGNIRSSTPTFDIVLVVYNPDGTIDEAFGQGGKVVSALTPNNEAVHVLAQQHDGKILAGGSVAGSALLARYNRDGTLDKTFGGGGFLISNFGYAGANVTGIAVLPNGEILILARGNHFNNKGTDIILAKYTNNGFPDFSFGKGGVSTADFAMNDVGVQLSVNSYGKIFVGGTLDVSVGNGDFAIYAFNADGTSDLSFGDGGKAIAASASHDVAETFWMQENGKSFLVTGQTITPDGNRLLLSRFKADGSIDLSFGDNGRVISNVEGDEVFSKSVIIGEYVYVAGAINEFGSTAAIISYMLDVPVKITCPTDLITTTDKGICAATGTNLEPVILPAGKYDIVYYLSGASNTKGAGTADGVLFNKGTTSVTYVLANDATKTCSFNVVVNDEELPVIQGLSVTTTALWPPNNKMRDIELLYELTDNCGVKDSSISISVNDVDGVTGSNEPDFELVNNHLIRLRAEKASNGKDRIYTIKVKTTDFSGNTTTDSLFVSVTNDYGLKTALQNQALRNGQAAGAEANSALQVKVLANPTTVYFTLMVLTADAGKKVTMKVVNALGMIVEMRENLTSGQKTRFGADYRPGIYFVEIVNGNQRKQLSIIKQ